MMGPNGSHGGKGERTLVEHEIVFDTETAPEQSSPLSNVDNATERLHPDKVDEDRSPRVPRSIALGNGEDHGNVANAEESHFHELPRELTAMDDEESGLQTSPSGDSSGDNSGGEKKHRFATTDIENNSNLPIVTDDDDDEDEDDDHIRSQRMSMLQDAHDAAHKDETVHDQQQCHAHPRRQVSSAPVPNQTRRRRKIASALKSPGKFLHNIREDDDHHRGSDDDEVGDVGDDGNYAEEDLARNSQAARHASATRHIMPTTQQNNTQYKLTAHHKSHSPHGGSCAAIASCLGCQTWGTIYDDAMAGMAVDGRYCNPNQVVMNYLHWSFRSSFAAVFLSAGVAFMGLTLFFAAILWALGQPHPTCIGGVDFENDYFTDAFVLSWTTFSTVGYGLIYSGISADEPDVHQCTGITIVVTIEAFVGVLFASFCGAIVFAKVNRAQSYAQVNFSDPMVIRFGSGVLVDEQDDEEQKADESARKKDDRPFHTSDDDDSNSSASAQQVHYPCPVLEFRVVNRLSTIAGGEILDAVVNIVASVDASQRTQIMPTLRRRRGFKGKKRPIRQADREKHEELVKSLRSRKRPQELSASAREASKGKFLASVKALLEETDARESNRGGLVTGIDSHRQSAAQQAFEVDPSGHLVPRRIFAKVEVETQDHPFLKRIWTVRHRLDERSPLLQTPVRDMIRANGGFWPPELNHAAGVRKAVQFDQILVSLSGTSNADANPVYTQKVYEYVDLCVGYRLANMLYRDDYTGNLRVDMRLINDVTEQSGPNQAEPLHALREISLGDDLEDMLIL
mmetsp:Transcript_2815/g.7892  ORF Transcript_2815/g.7892 Transcript_2815/m.7892 type:complete len:796 (-) Transcript_2815:184-2571(-)